MKRNLPKPPIQKNVNLYPKPINYCGLGKNAVFETGSGGCYRNVIKLSVFIHSNCCNGFFNMYIMYI